MGVARWGGAGLSSPVMSDHCLPPLHPLLYSLALCAVVWALVYAVRRWLPQLWSSLLALLALSGCPASLTPAQQLERQACLAEVELEWDRRADVECPPDDVYWDDCEHAPRLEVELAVEQRACSEGVRR